MLPDAVGQTSVSRRRIEAPIAKVEVMWFYNNFDQARSGFVEVRGAVYEKDLKTKAAKQSKGTHLQAIGNNTISKSSAEILLPWNSK